MIPLSDFLALDRISIAVAASENKKPCEKEYVDYFCDRNDHLSEFYKRLFIVLLSYTDSEQVRNLVFRYVDSTEGGLALASRCFFVIQRKLGYISDLPTGIPEIDIPQ